MSTFVHEERRTDFGRWMSKNLRSSSTGLCFGDIDYIVWDYKTKDLCIIEEKTGESTMNLWQKFLLNTLDKMLIQHSEEYGINYHGYHLIQLENTDPDNGLTKLNGKFIEAKELVNRLNNFDYERDYYNRICGRKRVTYS